MAIQKSEELEIRSQDDIGFVRHTVRQWAVEQGFSLVEQTKLVTAASELARNIVIHGGGKGHVRLEALGEGFRKGLRIIFEDQGPGIPDMDRALQDGYTTGGGLGMGLSGTRRLVNEFDIQTAVGRGTKITIARWR